MSKEEHTVELQKLNEKLDEALMREHRKNADESKNLTDKVRLLYKAVLLWGKRNS